MTSTFDWRQTIINSVWEAIPDLDCLLIINNGGKVLEHKVAEKHKNQEDHELLQRMARKVAIRFKIVDFDEEFGGLAITINILQRNVMLVRSLTSDYILILLAPSTIDIQKAINALSKTKVNKI